MFGDLDCPLHASRGLSASGDEFLVITETDGEHHHGILPLNLLQKFDYYYYYYYYYY